MINTRFPPSAYEQPATETTRLSSSPMEEVVMLTNVSSASSSVFVLARSLVTCRSIFAKRSVRLERESVNSVDKSVFMALFEFFTQFHDGFLKLLEFQRLQLLFFLQLFIV